MRDLESLQLHRLSEGQKLRTSAEIEKAVQKPLAPCPTAVSDEPAWLDSTEVQLR